MAFTKRTMMFFSFITVMVASTTAAVYEVGDSQGWIIGNIDYSHWASTKKFQVNDILIFNYNNKYHNVMQVSRQEYDSCTVTDPIATFNTVFNYNNKYHNVMQVSRQEYDSCTVTDPIATFNTGKDSITLPASGDYYYLCGIPGHCQIGQKLHIHIAASNATSSQGSVNNPSQTSAASPLSFVWFSLIGMLGFCFFLAY